MKTPQRLILILIPLTSCYSYSRDLVDNGSSWLEDDPSIHKIILDQTDSYGVLDVNKELYPKQNGQEISGDNVVLITDTPDGTATVRGGNCSTGSPCTMENIAVVMDDGKVGNIIGAYAFTTSDATVVSNVYLNNYAEVKGSIYGAFNIAAHGHTIGNVYLNDYAQVPDIYGAYALGFNNATTHAIGNVYLNNDVIVSNNIYAAFASISGNGDANASATGTVYVSDNAQVTNTIYGAFVGNGVSDNSHASGIGNVYLTDNAQAGTIYAAYIDGDNSAQLSTVSAQGNVSILDNAKLAAGAELWGGYMEESATYYQIFNHNTLTMGANALTVTRLGNFENYIFYLNDYNKDAIANGTALITVTDTLQNSPTVEDNGSGTGHTITNKANIKIAGISGADIAARGTTITLIDAHDATFHGGEDTGQIGGLFTTQTGDKATDIPVGLVGKTDATFTVDNVNNKITATIDPIQVDDSRVDTNITPLAEGRLAALEHITRGGDLVMSNIGDNKPVASYTPLLLLDGSVNKYHSDSPITAHDYQMIIGSRYQFLANLFVGIAGEYGQSHYTTNNNLAAQIINGDGNTHHYGLTLFGKYSHDWPVGHSYSDASMGLGRTSNQFATSDIVLGSGDTAYYHSKANYLAAAIASGYVYPLSATTSFDTSLHYRYTRLDSDSVVLDGDQVHFAQSTSSRVQFREQYNYQVNKQITLYFAGSYEYEFNSKVTARLSDISIDAPNAAGATAAIELGIKDTPLTINKNYALAVKLLGYRGKRDGATLSAAIGYTF